MARGRHARTPSNAVKAWSAFGGFALVAICAIAIVTVAMQRRGDDRASTRGSAVTQTSPARSHTTVPSTNTAPSSTRAASPSTQVSTSTTTSIGAKQFAGGKADLSGKVVVIDPGHNGGNSSHSDEINRLVPAGGFEKACDTSGTQTYSGYPEHAFTWDVSNRLATLLRAEGATVYLTRDSDDGVGPCVDVRAASGGLHNANVAISIHADGGPDGGRGFHVLPPAGCTGCENQIVPASNSFAEILRDTFRAETPMPVSTYAGSNGIMPRTDLAGINLSTVPKVFIECGNMRNSTDASLLEDAGFRETAAQAINDAIAKFLGQN